MIQDLEYEKIVHCPNDDADVRADECCFCEYYVDTNTFLEVVRCNCPKVAE